jgi:hypothetical protein
MRSKGWARKNGALGGRASRSVPRAFAKVAHRHPNSRAVRRRSHTETGQLPAD